MIFNPLLADAERRVARGTVKRRPPVALSLHSGRVIRPGVPAVVRDAERRAATASRSPAGSPLAMSATAGPAPVSPIIIDAERRARAARGIS